MSIEARAARSLARHMRTIALRPWAAGFRFLKGARWHADQLWVTDVCGGQVFRINPCGMADPAISVPGGPTGLAFLSDGSALIVTARSRTVFRWSGGALSAHCDLAPLVSGELTDIAIDHLDRAYVTTFDATEPAPRCFKTARISLVTPDGVGRVAASGFALPNAVAISPDQRDLIVAETHSGAASRGSTSTLTAAWETAAPCNVLERCSLKVSVWTTWEAYGSCLWAGPSRCG